MPTDFDAWILGAGASAIPRSSGTLDFDTRPSEHLLRAKLGSAFGQHRVSRVREIKNGTPAWKVVHTNRTRRAAFRMARKLRDDGRFPGRVYRVVRAKPVRGRKTVDWLVVRPAGANARRYDRNGRLR